MTRLRWSAFGLAIYVLFLLIGPFLHHDLACELKTPQHCTVCCSPSARRDARRPPRRSDFLLLTTVSSNGGTYAMQACVLRIARRGRSRDRPAGGVRAGYPVGAAADRSVAPRF